MSPPSIHRLQLHEGEAMRARLVHYAPRFRQSAHSHDELQVSFLLLGTFEERSGAREASPPCQSLSVRPAGASHTVAFGDDGALILSLELLGSDLPISASPCSWHTAHRTLGPLLRTALAEGEPERQAEALWDLLALATTTTSSRNVVRKPARWLEQVMEAIEDDPSSFRVADAARRAGVHRVHLSRSFTRAYGQAPSVFRQRCMAGRAIANVLCDGLSLARAAANAGFADQSHFTRVCSREIGALPSRLRRQFGGLHSFKTQGHATG